jgi:hypothetical protein
VHAAAKHILNKLGGHYSATCALLVHLSGTLPLLLLLLHCDYSSTALTAEPPRALPIMSAVGTTRTAAAAAAATAAAATAATAAAAFLNFLTALTVELPRSHAILSAISKHMLLLLLMMLLLLLHFSKHPTVEPPCAHAHHVSNKAGRVALHLVQDADLRQTKSSKGEH